MYLRNSWYVAAWGHEVTKEPRPIRVLDEPIVVARGESGRPFALENACPHRKLPLSMGKLKGETIECGYHGLTFDGSGACVHAPGQTRIPTGAKVRSYPVADKWGLVWIWMGDPARADASAIFPVEHYEDPAWGINRGPALDFDCNYLYITDNLLDPTHVSWVHPSTFGEAACADTPLEVDVAETGVTVSRWMLDVDVAPLYKPLVPFTGRADRLQHYEVRYPCLAIIKAVITPAGKGGRGRPLPEDGFVMDSYNFMTPVDATHTRYYWFQMRNVQPDSAEISALMTKGVELAFNEDRVVLNAVQRGMDSKTSANIDLSIDAGALRFRRALDRLIAGEAQRAEIAAE